VVLPEGGEFLNRIYSWNSSFHRLFQPA
jgi:hypothetical protein